MHCTHPGSAVVAGISDVHTVWLPKPTDCCRKMVSLSLGETGVRNACMNYSWHIPPEWSLLIMTHHYK